MTNEASSQPLKVFLCHASTDKSKVRQLYIFLRDNGFDPWLDEEKLIPGHDWQLEIPKAVRAADVVVICLSRSSINKEGYVQKEISFALDVADEKPEGKIYLIPARLEECEVPSRLSRWQWVDLFTPDGGKKLLAALALRDGTVKNNQPNKKVNFADTFLYGDAEPIPSISTLDEEEYYSDVVDKTPFVSELSPSESEKIFGELHKIGMPVVGALSGFVATLSFRVFSKAYHPVDGYSMAAVATRMVADSDFLFVVLLLGAVLLGGGGAFLLNEYYQKQNIPILIRYLITIPTSYFLGLLLDIASCIFLPLLLAVGIGFLLFFIYKEKG